MFITKKNILFIINKPLISLKCYVMIFDQTFKFAKYVSLLKKNTHY